MFQTRISFFSKLDSLQMHFHKRTKDTRSSLFGDQTVNINIPLKKSLSLKLDFAYFENGMSPFWFSKYSLAEYLDWKWKLPNIHADKFINFAYYFRIEKNWNIHTTFFIYNKFARHKSVIYWFLELDRNAFRGKILNF